MNKQTNLCVFFEVRWDKADGETSDQNPGPAVNNETCQACEKKLYLKERSLLLNAEPRTL